MSFDEIQGVSICSSEQIKMTLFYLLLLFLSFSSSSASPCEALARILNTWNGDQDGVFNLIVPSATTTWTIAVTFDLPNIRLNSWNGANTKCVSGGQQTVCTFDNQVFFS